ncbi:hypothetical protein D3C80_1892860 [compost metagenome]
MKPAKGAQPANKPVAKAAQGKKPRRDDDHEIGGRPNVPGPAAFENKSPAGKGGAGKGAASKGAAGKGAPAKGGKPAAAGKPRTNQGGRQKKGR